VSEIKIGDTIWRFNENRRVYAPDKRGGPIYAEDFEPEKIVGETPKCWIVGEGRRADKVNKKTLRTAVGKYGATLYFTDAGKEDSIWMNSHRYKIVRLVEKADAATLRQIADIVGYKPEEAA